VLLFWTKTAKPKRALISSHPTAPYARDRVRVIVTVPYLARAGSWATDGSPGRQPLILSAWDTKGNGTIKAFLIIVNKSAFKEWKTCAPGEEQLFAAHKRAQLQ
jgi:hypothetical protein